MTDYFLDTVGVLAILDEDDQWHKAAYQAFEAITRPTSRLFTTTFVMLEIGPSVLRPLRPAAQFLSRE